MVLESFYNDALKNNEDLILTIDRDLQAQAEKVLSNLIEKFQATGGTVIIQKAGDRRNFGFNQ